MIGTQEMVIVFAAIILLFGASKLPELARSLGKSTSEFKKARMEAETELEGIKDITKL